MGSDDISALQTLDLHGYAFDYQTHAFTRSRAVHADCFEWLGRLAPAAFVRRACAFAAASFHRTRQEGA